MTEFLHTLYQWFLDVFVDNFDAIFLLGLFAQSLFMMRFVVQWIASERVGRSIVPIAFWFFSVSGGLLLLTYGVLRKEPILILGQSLGLIIYFRNLRLIFTERKSAAHPPEKISDDGIIADDNPQNSKDT